ncbi:hypothetical protein RN001_003485 [Aquatica leii]|uniref:FLYWCH-type domain-containing protein n=1 Tax=Aquatica leii TaxID=1421715 RepID=A0AAN7PID7_9COLE|nr:hypothetical protein RN001_003485 [Aquatica leii]
MIRSIRNKEKYEHNGYLYCLDKLISNGSKKSWRCDVEIEKNKRCKGRIYTDALSGEFIRCTVPKNTVDQAVEEWNSRQEICQVETIVPVGPGGSEDVEDAVLPEVNKEQDDVFPVPVDSDGIDQPAEDVQRRNDQEPLSCTDIEQKWGQTKIHTVTDETQPIQEFFYVKKRELPNDVDKGFLQSMTAKLFCGTVPKNTVDQAVEEWNSRQEICQVETIVPVGTGGSEDVEDAVSPEVNKEQDDVFPVPVDSDGIDQPAEDVQRNDSADEEVFHLPEDVYEEVPCTYL